MSGRRLRVLHVLSSLGMGGVETWLMALLKHWGATGAVQMDLLLTGREPGILEEQAITLGARIHRIPYSRRELPRFVPRYRRLLCEQRYDAIHDHSDYASGWHFLFAAGVLPPVRVTHVHNPWLHVSANYAVSPARCLAASVGERLVYRLATHVCGTSKAILAEYGFEVGRARPLVRALHCGIDIDKFNAPRAADRTSVLQEFGWPEDTKIILFAGRLDRALEFDHPQNHKNSWFALNVAKLALDRDPSIRLLMAGDSSTTGAALQVRIESWGYQEQLRLIGIRRDLPRLMRASRCLLFPSRQEGLGMVAVEAQSAGLPVLSSSAVPLEACVVPDLCAALSLDQPLTLWAEKLIELSSRSDYERDVCRALLERSDFSITSSARHLEDVYNSGRRLGAA